MSHLITKDAQRRMLRLMQAFGLPRCIRLPTKNTTENTYISMLVAETLPIDRVVLAAKADPLNRAQFVAAFRTPDLTVIMDTDWLTIARQPRQREVMELTRKLNELGLLARGQYAPELVEDTSQLTPEEAAEVLLEKTHLEPINGNLGPYLRVLGQASLSALGVTEDEFLHQPSPVQHGSSRVPPDTTVKSPHDQRQ